MALSATAAAMHLGEANQIHCEAQLKIKNKNGGFHGELSPVPDVQVHCHCDLKNLYIKKYKKNRKTEGGDASR